MEGAPLACTPYTLQFGFNVLDVYKRQLQEELPRFAFLGNYREDE